MALGLVYMLLKETIISCSFQTPSACVKLLKTKHFLVQTNLETCTDSK